MVDDLNIMDEVLNDAQEEETGMVQTRHELEQEIFQDPDQIEQFTQGRMSPQAKETLYRSYLQGTTIKDLSLKYGIFP